MKKSPLISLMALGAVAWPVTGKTLPPIGSRMLDEATRNKILLINEGEWADRLRIQRRLFSLDLSYW
jgi:hypothetical protein